jgi:hypothetical protein
MSYYILLLRLLWEIYIHVVVTLMYKLYEKFAFFML